MEIEFIILDNFLGVFTSYIDSGFGLLGGEVAFLSTTLIAIDVTLAGLFWAWGADEDVLQRLVKKTLYIGTFAFIIGNFALLATIVFESFAGLGLQASGGAMTIDEFMKPGTIAAKGLEAAKPLLDAAGQFSSLWAVFSNLALILVLLLAWVIVVLAFFIIAVQVFITLIEFKLVTLAGFVLLPFAFFNKTAFMAEKVLGHVVSTGIKVLVLAVIIGIGSTLFSEFTSGFGGQNPSIDEAMGVPDATSWRPSAATSEVASSARVTVPAASKAPFRRRTSPGALPRRSLSAAPCAVTIFAPLRYCGAAPSTVVTSAPKPV